LLYRWTSRLPNRKALDDVKKKKKPKEGIINLVIFHGVRKHLHPESDMESLGGIHF
jgi:hypothetical protein